MSWLLMKKNKPGSEERQPLLDKLKDDANFWIKQDLYDIILSK